MDSILGAPVNKAFSLYAGFSKIDITPREPMGMELLGMPRLYPGARGVLDPLFVRACYLECGKDKFLMLVSDTVGYDASEPEHHEVLRRLARKLSIPLQNIWLVATHCHSSVGKSSGPPTFQAKVWSRYMGEFLEKLAQVAAEAVAGNEPVEMGYAQVDVAGVGGSRRVKLSDGLVVTGWGDGPSALPGLKTVGRGPHDPGLGVIVFRNMKGQSVGTILNYNSHIHMYPILDFSSELAGYTCRLLEKKIKGVTAIYTNGAMGDVSLCPNIPPFPGASGGVESPVLCADAAVKWHSGRQCPEKHARYVV